MPNLGMKSKSLVKINALPHFLPKSETLFRQNYSCLWINHFYKKWYFHI